MGGKLFSSYRTVFGLGQGLQDSKTSDLNCLYDALVQREALRICQDRVFGSFLCSISIISSRERFMHLYCDTSSLGRSAPVGESPPSSLAFPIHLFAVNILSKSGEKYPSL